MSEHAQDKNEILANFQALTGLEDSGIALTWLEESDWDLEAAVKKMIPDNQIQENNFQDIHNGFPELSQTEGRLDLIIFSLNDSIEVSVRKNCLLSELKENIYERKRIPVQHQVISGFKKEPDDSKSLIDLGISSSKCLFFVSPNQPSTSAEQDVLPRDQSYARKFKIDDTVNKTSYIVIVSSEVIVSTFESQLKMLTNLSNVRFLGWPPTTRPDHWLVMLDLDTPFHVIRIERAVEESRPTAMCIDLTADTDSSPEDFEDASESFTGEDEIFIDENVTSRTTPLIPDNVEDETAGTVHFIDGFIQRYGQASPNFLPGTLDDAIRESFSKPARDRRMLALYLHHDGSVLTNVFCAELMCSETVLQTFANHFILWGWDITNSANRHMLLASMVRSLGSSVSETVRIMTTEQLPALLIITQNRCNIELFNVIYGNIGLNDFLGTLMHAVDIYSEIQETDIRDEEERAVRQQIKTEQDRAFQQSLLMDRAKDEAKRLKLMEEIKEEQRQKEAKETEDKKRLEEQNEAQSQLAPEPTDNSEGLLRIKFTSPVRDTFERKFLQTDTLKHMFNYLLVEGFRISEFKVITGWPRRDLTSMDESTTLKSLQLHPQETFILSER